MEHLTLESIKELPRDYLTAKEAAAVMGISVVSFYKCHGKFPFPILRVGRSYRILKKPFLEYMEVGRSGKG